MKKLENQLDEQQELRLLQIEHRTCWLAFWALLAAIVVQTIAYGASFSRIEGEWIILMVMALYLGVSCIRAGIWDRRLKMNLRTNVVVSLVAGLVVGAVNFFAIFSRFPDAPGGAAAAGIVTAVMTFALCLLALTLAAKATAKRQAKLDAEPEDEI